MALHSPSVFGMHLSVTLVSSISWVSPDEALGGIGLLLVNRHTSLVSAACLMRFNALTQKFSAQTVFCCTE